MRIILHQASIAFTFMLFSLVTPTTTVAKEAESATQKDTPKTTPSTTETAPTSALATKTYGDCFKEDPELGQAPIPNCEAELTLPGGTKVKTKFNSMGLRDREYTTKAPEGTLRVLVLGSPLVGHRLTDEELPARQLERRVRAMGFNNIEVINGAVGEYRLPRYSIWAKRLIRNYYPEVVIYFQMGQQFQEDFLEYTRMEVNSDGYPVKYILSRDEIEVPRLITEYFPGQRGFYKNLILNKEALESYWSVYWASQDSKEYAKKFLRPAHISINAIQNEVGAMRQFYVAWAPTVAHNGNTVRGVGKSLGTVLQLAMPKVVLQPRELNESIHDEGGFEPIPMPLKFKEGRKNKLLERDNSPRLTPSGADLWASTVALTIKEEFKMMPVRRKEEELLRMPFPKVKPAAAHKKAI